MSVLIGLCVFLILGLMGFEINQAIDTGLDVTLFMYIIFSILNHLIGLFVLIGGIAKKDSDIALDGLVNLVFYLPCSLFGIASLFLMASNFSVEEFNSGWFISGVGLFILCNFARNTLRQEYENYVKDDLSKRQRSKPCK